MDEKVLNTYNTQDNGPTTEINVFDNYIQTSTIKADKSKKLINSHRSHKSLFDVNYGGVIQDDPPA